MIHVYHRWLKLELSTKKKTYTKLILYRLLFKKTLYSIEIIEQMVRLSKLQNLVKNCLKLWSFFCDLEDTTGNTYKTNDIHSRVLALIILSLLLVMNYAGRFFFNKRARDALFVLHF